MTTAESSGGSSKARKNKRKAKMSNWGKFSKPPKEALKPISAGRLKGKSDINPQWRMFAMDQVFGQCGIGWKYEIVRLWTEEAAAQQVFAFAHVNLYTKHENEWSAPIPGIGGHMLIVKESSGLHSNDEAFKMALTDALSVAMKAIGVAADIYLGNFDGSKYTRETPDIQHKEKGNRYARCETLDALQSAFKADYEAAKSLADKELAGELISDKDARKKELEK